jgi:haloalkane dehalogenase
MRHYREVQPAPADRVGVAELPKQIVKATPFLAALEQDVARELGDKPVLITYPMRDRAFPAASVLPRMRQAFADVQVRELPEAKHFFVEDAPQEVAEAIRARFA